MTKTRIVAVVIFILYLIAYIFLCANGQLGGPRQLRVYGRLSGGLSPLGTSVLGLIIIYVNATPNKKIDLNNPEHLPDALNLIFIMFLGWTLLLFFPLLTVLGTM